MSYIRIFIATTFLFIQLAYPFSLTQSHAQSVYSMPPPGTMLKASQSYDPLLIKGLTLHPEDPFLFDFIIDKGQSGLKAEGLDEEIRKVIKYFLASLTIPEDDFWVNLSPYEQNRIMPEVLGQTEIGRDLLIQDYVLKQLSSSLMYPETELGQTFWAKVSEQAFKKFGTTELSMNAINKVWIIPEKAALYENNQTVVIVESRLKVMLDKDYHAMQQARDDQPYPEEGAETVDEGVVRDVLIPAIENEVNKGQHFTQLRQIYHGAILAAWFKQRLKESLLTKLYVDQNKIRGIDIRDEAMKEKVYEQYLEAFRKGVYNYIREEYNPVDQEIIARKYFSGGTVMKVAPQIFSKDEGRIRAEVSSGIKALLQRIDEFIINAKVQIIQSFDTGNAKNPASSAADAADAAMLTGIDKSKIALMNRNMNRLRGNHDISDESQKYAIMQGSIQRDIQTLAAIGEHDILIEIIRDSDQFDSFVVQETLLSLSIHADLLTPENEALVVSLAKQYVRDEKASDQLVVTAVEVFKNINKTEVIASVEEELLSVIMNRSKPFSVRVASAVALVKHQRYDRITQIIQYLITSSDGNIAEASRAGDMLKEVLRMSGKKLYAVANGQARINAIQSVIDYLNLSSEDIVIGYVQADRLGGTTEKLIQSSFPDFPTMLVADSREYDQEAYIRIQFKDGDIDVWSKPLTGFLELETIKGHVRFIAQKEVEAMREQLNIGNRPVIVIGSPTATETNQVVRDYMELFGDVEDQSQKPLLIIGFRRQGDDTALNAFRKDLTVSDRTQEDKEADRPLPDLSDADVFSVSSIGELGAFYALARGNGVGIISHDRNMMELAQQGIAFIHMPGSWTLNRSILNFYLEHEATQLYSKKALSEILSDETQRNTLAEKALLSARLFEVDIQKTVSDLGLILSLFTLDALTPSDSAMLSQPIPAIQETIQYARQDQVASEENVGGIDLRLSAFNNVLSSLPQEFKIVDYENLSPTFLQTLGVDGFVPVIIQITPAKDLPSLLE